MASPTSSTYPWHLLAAITSEQPLAGSPSCMCWNYAPSGRCDAAPPYTGSFSIACATTDTAAAIAAHAAHGAWPRNCGTNFSILSRRSLPAAAYRPTHADISAAPMAIQEAAPVMNQRLLAQEGRTPVQAGSASHSAHRIRRSSSPTLIKTKGASSWPVFEPTNIAGTPYASLTVAVFAIPALLSFKRPGCSPFPCRRPDYR